MMNFLPWYEKQFGAVSAIGETLYSALLVGYVLLIGLIVYYFFSTVFKKNSPDPHIQTKPQKKETTYHYINFFSLDEVATSRTVLLALCVVAGAHVLLLLQHARHILQEGSICPITYLNCQWLVNTAIVYDTGFTILYWFVVLLLLAAVYLFWRTHVHVAHFFLMIGWVFHGVIMLFFSEYATGHMQWYIFILGGVLLLLPDKRFSAQCVLAYCYILSVWSKLTPSWLLGGFFGPLEKGLPLIPSFLEPLLMHMVIILELVGALLLFSQSDRIRRGVIAAFGLFHVYSIILVGWVFPLLVYPFVTILFWHKPQYPKGSVLRRIPLLILLAVLSVMQLLSWVIPGDSRLTHEGVRFGLHMFNAHHQCIRELTVKNQSGEILYQEPKNIKHYRVACDAYRLWARAQKYCSAGHDVSIQLAHAINGGPLLQTINEQDACTLTYSRTSHNSWIKTQTAPVVGSWPGKEAYWW